MQSHNYQSVARKSKPDLTTTLVFVVLYGLATLQFIRYYSKSTTFYLKMNAYLNGTERLPFQERILPAFFIRPIIHSVWVTKHLVHQDGMFTADRGPFYLLSLISMVVAGVYTQRLYSLLTANGWLRSLVYPIFLFTVMWTYAIHSEADYSYPYDFPSVAFFAAGMFYIYARQFRKLLLVMLLGTFNRETTLFLIGIFLLDAASNPDESDVTAPRFLLSRVPWLKVSALSAIWLAIKLFLVHRYRFNDASEQFLRIHYNMERMTLRLLPAMLNLCGYTLPLVVIFSSRLKPQRFRNYLYILIPWFAVMFCSGVLIETRIYGELCSFASIALVLIMERSVRAESSAPAAVPATTTLQTRVGTLDPAMR